MANIIHKGDSVCAHIYTHSRYTESIVSDKFTKLSDIVTALILKNDIPEKDYKHHFIEVINLSKGWSGWYNLNCRKI